MSDYIIEIDATDGQWDELNPLPAQSVKMAEYDDKQAYLTTHTNWPASMVIVGEWDQYTGKPLRAISDIYEQKIRPLGNSSGMATGLLDSHRWAGHSEAKYFEYDDTDPEDIKTERYPATNRPFSLKIERTYITDDGFPQIPHGWKVTMLSDDPLRDITARAIGIYNSGGGYLYTTGAFIDDGAGNFFTECPVGQRTADEADVYFKLLLGPAPEGAWTLPIGKAEDVREFWANDQGGGSWSDSGQTVSGMAGTVTLIQDNSAFPVGTLVRIEGVEMEVTSLWTGIGIVLNPYRASATGSVVEVFA